MLIGIIKEEKNNLEYHIHLEDNRLSVLCLTEDNIEVLNKDEVKDLFNALFLSRLTYKEKYNDYDIYLDEANNKRYFKDGVEDFNLFFENNGVDATLYLEKIDKTKASIPKVKRIKLVSTLLAFEIMLSPTFIVPFLTNSKITDDLDVAVNFYRGLEVDEMEKLISNSAYLSNDEKHLLNNEELLKFVLENSNNNKRKYILRNKLSGLHLKSFTPNEEKQNLEGFYSPLDLNTIYISEDLENDPVTYEDALTHEYIHLLQDNNKYSYIQEACAEIMSSEFCGTRIDTYKELVKRVQVLMEIIGPKPIIDCNFKGDTKSFEDAIGMYLSEEDKNTLLEQLSIPSLVLTTGKVNINHVNAKIDEMLSKMYQAKTGKDILDDMMIRTIYIAGVDDRIYFNYNLEEYDKDYYLNPMRIDLEKMSVDEMISSNKVKKYIWSQRSEQDVNGDKLLTYKRVETTDFNEIKLSENEWIDIEFTDGTRGHVEYDFENDEWKLVEHFQLSSKFEPSIRKKFKDQFKEKTNDIEILDMLETEVIEDRIKVR